MERQHLRILVVEDSINAAQQLLNAIRNIGYPVRESRADDEETLVTALEQGELDLLFCSVDLEGLDVAKVRAALDRAGQNIPLVGFQADVDITATVKAMKAGATALVSPDRQDYLKLVLERELDFLHLRRTLKQTESALQESEQRCQVLLESSKDAVAYVLDGMHIYANRVYLDLFGFDDMEDIEGMPIMDMVEPEDHAKLKDFLGRYMRGDESARELDLRGLRQDESVLSISMEFSDATYEDESCTQVVIRDHTAARMLESEMEDLKVRDPLTALFNRGYFLNQLEQNIEDERREKAGLLFLEVDGMQNIRDQHGLAGSDVTLRELAAVLDGAFGHMGSPARLTDEAFGVLVEDASVLQKLVDPLLKEISEFEFTVDGKPIQVTASVGWSPLILLPNETSAALDCVEQACADARAGGGNAARRYRVADDELEDAGSDQKQLAVRVRDAIKENRLKLYYQPIVSLHGGVAENYEVLLRMVNENGDIIEPRNFLGAAESYGLGPSLDRWVVANTLHVLAKRVKAGRDMNFFVKLSASTLTDAKFLPWLKGRLELTGLPGNRLILETNESAVMAKLKESKRFADQVNKLGCRFAIDHFGANSGGIKILKHLPADFIRIHGDLVLNMVEDEAAFARVESIAEAVNRIGKTTIACHVDDSGVLPLLWQVGVGYIQGNFLQVAQDSLDFDFVGEMV